MHSIINLRFKQSTFLKNTFFLSVASILAQLISVLVSPILSRLYTPMDFGELGKIVAYTSIFASIASLKYDTAIVLSKSSSETKQLIRWSHIFILGISFIAIPLYALIYGSIEFSILFIIFLMIYLNGILNLTTNIFTRFKQFKKLAKLKILNKASGASFQIGFGVLGFGFIGLALGQVLSLLFSYTFIGFQAQKNFYQVFKIPKNSFNEAKTILKNHYRFPIFTTPQTLLNGLSQNAPILLLDQFFGNSAVGFYWFSYRIINLPIVFISNAFRQTFFQKASTFKSKADLKNLHLKSTWTLLLMGLPLTLLGMQILPFVFGYFFGPEWKEAGIYAKWLLPWVLSLFINPPSTTLIPLLNLQKFNLIYDIALLILRILVVILGGFYFDSITSIIFFSFTGVVFNLFLIIYIHTKIK